MTDVSIPLFAMMAAVALVSANSDQVNVGQLSEEQVDPAPATYSPIVQISGPPGSAQSGTSDAVVDQLDEKASASGDVDQLSDTLEPLGEGDETELVSRGDPKGDLTSQVITAWHAIRQRGQTPTPDLIASEIGAEKVAEFLAGGGQAASVLATGQLPEGAPPPYDPQSGAPPPPPPPPPRG